jgi:hypothetical protein
MCHLRFHLVTIPHAGQLGRECLSVCVYEFAELANPSQNGALIHLDTVELCDMLSYFSQRCASIVEVKCKRDNLGVKAAPEKAFIYNESLAACTAFEYGLPSLARLAVSPLQEINAIAEATVVECENSLG